MKKALIAIFIVALAVPATSQALTLTLNPKPMGGVAVGYNYDTDVKWGRVWAGTPIISLDSTITMYGYGTWSGSLTEPPKSGLGGDIMFAGALYIPRLYGLVGAGRMANATPEGNAGWRYLMGGAYGIGKSMTLILLYELVDRGAYGFDDNIYLGIGIDNLWK